MEKHDLHHEFPEFDQRIHDLKISNNHFRRFFDEYHEVNDLIHRFETGAEHVSDEVMNQHRQKRVHLKDSLYKMLVEPV